MAKRKGTEKTMKEFVQDQMHAARTEFGVPDKKDNAGPMLADVFFWQEVSAMAEKALKEAWAALQGEDGFIGDDDALRDLGPGEQIVAESGSFSCLIKVTEPRKSFSREDFIWNISKRFKAKKEDLEKIAESSMKAGKASLTKRIVEA